MILPAGFEQILTPKDLVKCARGIASKWKGVGLHLGLELEEINIIEADHPTSCEKACEAMLSKWYKKTIKPTLGKLNQAVENYKANSGSYMCIE